MLFFVLVLYSIFEVFSDFVHQIDGTFDSEVTDVVVDITDSEQRVEDRDEDCLWQDFSSVKLTDEIEVSIELDSEKDLCLFADITLLQLGDIEELLKALLAYFKECSSKDGVFHGLNCLLQVLKLKLEFNHLFAELSIENTIFLFNLGLAEDVVDDGFKDILPDFFGSQLEFFTVINAFILTLLTSLKAIELELTKLSEFLLKVFRGNYVQDQSDLLGFILLHCYLLLHRDGLLLQLGFLLAVFWFPRSLHAVLLVTVWLVVVIVIRLSGPHCEVITMLATWSLVLLSR